MWSFLPVPQHRGCPGFKRPPAEDHEEAGRGPETQGTGELLESPPWGVPSSRCVLTLSLCRPPALLCPEHAWQPAGHALGRTVNRDGSQSQAAHVVSATRATGSWPDKICPILYNCIILVNTRESHRQGTIPTLVPAVDRCVLSQKNLEIKALKVKTNLKI